MIALIQSVIQNVQTMFESSTRRKLLLAALVLISIGAMFYTGFIGDIGRALSYRMPSIGLSADGAGLEYDGAFTLEERIAGSHAIAIVRLIEKDTVTESFIEYWNYWNEDDELIEIRHYTPALEFRFKVLEYLKGSGAEKVEVIVPRNPDTYETYAGATLLGEDLTDKHVTDWDDREAIVFLWKYIDDVIPREDMEFPSVESQPDRYLFGGFIGSNRRGENSYSLLDSERRQWLPAAKANDAISAPSTASGKLNQREQFFLLEPIDTASEAEFIANSAASAVNARRLSGDAGVVSLSQLKKLIAEIEAEIAAGDGSDTYLKCVFEKYRWIRKTDYNGWGTEIQYLTEHKIASGLPARAAFSYGSYPIDKPHPLPDDIEDDIIWDSWLEGIDAHHFTLGSNLYHIGVARPLPQGEYHYYFNTRDDIYIPCDAYPEGQRTWNPHIVEVTAPAGTLHEAFFDPVALDGTVGADGASGVLKPASFAFDGSDAAIERIDWLDGQARLTLAPHAALADHHIDFIALDGSVSLRLDFDDAAQVADADGNQTLVWGVCSQPWQPGDLLMLRISESPADLAGATFNADCAPAATASPTPTPEVMPEPTPMDTPEPDSKDAAVPTATSTP